MKRIIFPLLFASIIFSSCISKKSSDLKSTNPKNIILMIGDGMGLAQIHAAMTTNYGNLNMLTFPVVGLHKTSSADKYITDSAAGATALSTGKKTKNGYLGMDSTKHVLKTILEYAEENGLSTGLVATSTIVHATPAGFIAHQPNRNMYEAIASDFLKTDIDVFIGGGSKYFNHRKDSINLFDSLKQKGYGVFTSLDDPAIEKYDKIAALTAADHNKKIIEGRRSDYLSGAAQIALDKLSKNDKGFFLMIEGSFIDKGCHANDTAYFLTETLDFDKVVGLVKKYAEKNKETLVIVTADHETSGLSIFDGDYKKGKVEVTFAKKGNVTAAHTAIMVPVFAYGPGANSFSGVYENTEIFSKMKSLFDFGR